jgi:endonuclease YncB( thermonuclease family)
MPDRPLPRWLHRRHALAPRRRPVVLPFLLLAAALLAAAFLAARLDPPTRLVGSASAADGDSLRLDGTRVRLLGLDAPELDQLCWYPDGSAWPCGRAAHAALAERVAAAQTTCIGSREDRYGRLLARCTTAGDDLGAALVGAGLAIATDAYGAEESAARAARRGIWNGRFTNPRIWRDAGPAGAPGSSVFEQIWNWLGS